MYKLIACDLDETLLHRTTKKVPQANRDAIAKAREKGAKFVVATGRPFFTVQGTLQEIDQYQTPGCYSIVLNGAQVVDHTDGKALFTDGVDYKTVKALFENAMRWDVGCHIYTDNEVYCFRCNENEKDFLLGRMDVDYRDSLDIDFLKERPLTKILFVNTNQEYLRELEKVLRPYSSDMEISYSSNRYLEFNKKGVTKGTALIKLAQILGMDPKETIAIGDNYNDLPMIMDAGLGVGVANSNPGIMEQCDFITEKDCDDCAVAEVIEKFVL